MVVVDLQCGFSISSLIAQCFLFLSLDSGYCGAASNEHLFPKMYTFPPPEGTSIQLLFAASTFERKFYKLPLTPDFYRLIISHDVLTDYIGLRSMINQSSYLCTVPMNIAARMALRYFASFVLNHLIRSFFLPCELGRYVHI